MVNTCLHDNTFPCTWLLVINHPGFLNFHLPRAAMVTGRDRIGLVVERLAKLDVPKVTWLYTLNIES